MAQRPFFIPTHMLGMAFFGIYQAETMGKGVFGKSDLLREPSGSPIVEMTRGENESVVRRVQARKFVIHNS